MKKNILLLVLVLILALMVVGCGIKQPTNDDVENASGDTQMGIQDEEEVTENKYDEVETNPVATFEIENMGIIKMELYPQIAPETVENFISLVESGFYDGLTFHRTIPGFVIQGGDPSGDGTGGPDYTIIGEFANNGIENNLSHTRGIVSMARGQEYNSAGSQFFVIAEDSTYLDGDYAAFGKVVEGMDVVDSIVNLEVIRRNVDEQIDYYTNPEEYIKQTLECDRPVNPPVITKATVETFGVEYAEPNKIKE